MTPEQFVYWLQGFAETGQDCPTAEQWKTIREHLDTVFTPETAAAKARQEKAASIAAKKERRKELIKALYDHDFHSVEQRNEMRAEFKELNREINLYDTRAFRQVCMPGRIC